MSYRFLSTLTLAMLLAACTSTSNTPQTDPLYQASAVSVNMPGFITSQETTLRWYSDLQWMDDPTGQYKRRAAVLQQALQQEFEFTEPE